MKVALACEFSSYHLKEFVLEYLLSQNHEVVDVGQKSAEDTMLYPAIAANVARVIQSGECKKGILICGSGAGVSIAANKFKGIYAVACESIFTAQGIPIINDANVLALGGNVVGRKNACAMIDKFLENTFAMGETEERVAFLAGMLNDVKQIEEENFR